MDLQRHGTSWFDKFYRANYQFINWRKSKTDKLMIKMRASVTINMEKEQKKTIFQL